MIQGRADGHATGLSQDQDLNATAGHESSAVPLLYGLSGHGQQTDTRRDTALDMLMSSRPLSHGQQQLFSLARAILMRAFRGNIVLLDEASSSVDADTDKYMQQIIREEFRDHTVLTIAHRLETILDSNVVMVMDVGRLVEFGSPDDLMEKEDGFFRKIHGA